MRVGDHVVHRSLWRDSEIGELVEIYDDGTCKAVFPRGVYSGISLDNLTSAEDLFQLQKLNLAKAEILGLLQSEKFELATQIYDDKYSVLWDRADFETTKKEALEAAERRLAEEQAQALIFSREIILEAIAKLLDGEKYGEADEYFREKCGDWWPKSEFEALVAETKYRHKFVGAYFSASLGELDALYRDRPVNIDFPVEDFISLKLPKVRNCLSAIGMDLDDEQVRANARPEERLLITARAGSGKTRTLCAKAALSIGDEKLNPDQVMILAFNKAAAVTVKKRLHKEGQISDYSNARTFHSLAYQLVKPHKKLLFDAGGTPSSREQSRFAQRLMERILNPAFKEAMLEFFRQELEQIESIGRDLSPAEYQIFRRSLEYVTLKGERVKSNGEKFIADFLFEHGIEHRYEKPWAWKVDFLDGSVYKPDFSIVANGRDFILEHWAIDPDDPRAAVPAHWDTSTQAYRNQIEAKRSFWESHQINLLETHTGHLRNGRVNFEAKLQSILEKQGIKCIRLNPTEIIRRVFENDFTISRMAELFLQFIQRSKRRAWSVDAVAAQLAISPDIQPRARLFHQLALRAYREYEAMLAEVPAMDFDDLLMQATQEVRVRGAAACIHLGEGRMMPLGQLRWILLDEYQDFSELYFQMLDAILKANPSIRLIAVGDDWQAINTFAGADLRFFNDFGSFFPNSNAVGVTTNYRSDSLVVAAGNRLMAGRGQPAKGSRLSRGQIKTYYLGDIWLEFRGGDQHQVERNQDLLFLPEREDNRGPSPSMLRLAQALKFCAQRFLEFPQEKIMILARGGFVYGVELSEFKDRLVAALCKLSEATKAFLEEKISTMTAHGSKGQESHTVIILDATQRQFPKVHPDNLLFVPFGVTPRAVLDEERRLFYVAITRAEHRLFVLTDKGAESPYLSSLEARAPVGQEANGRRSNVPDELGVFGQKIKNQIDEFEDAFHE
ncbi:UvrD-helicase domain-containing protein [Actimicrobium sp. CCI2.3]|uniref:UvrD-helicase domain-containing protein n=1 Tax=Actimicrobium sp. CCI2.3 TaxID=3048616 RepID=UPI002AB35A67|nr:UvrD-helicase domain-containing protein [Actimicrobium sp. CCI2.3]MDY7573082.1 UvrD-helicase domain-containing protein [Actimicrobium sp. CCI2.3]MEB0020879.1 UvrD-helicase domain-containing protein [Actimicrobium sp. CCI2.3]